MKTVLKVCARILSLLLDGLSYIIVVSVASGIAFFWNPCDWLRSIRGKENAGDCANCSLHPDKESLCKMMYKIHTKTDFLRNVTKYVLIPFAILFLVTELYFFVDRNIQSAQEQTTISEKNQKDIENKLKTRLETLGFTSTGDFQKDKVLYRFFEDYRAIGGTVTSIKIINQDNEAIYSMIATIRMDNRDFLCTRTFPTFLTQGRVVRSITPIDSLVYKK